MTKEIIISRLRKKELIKKIKEKWVWHFSIFGSYARWENSKDSDLDVLVDIKNYNWFTFATITEIVDLIKQETWIQKIDFVTSKSINKKIKSQIEKDLINIF